MNEDKEFIIRRYVGIFHYERIKDTFRYYLQLRREPFTDWASQSDYFKILVECGYIRL